MKTLSHTQCDECLIFGVHVSLTWADFLTLGWSTLRQEWRSVEEVSFKKQLSEFLFVDFYLAWQTSYLKMKFLIQKAAGRGAQRDFLMSRRGFAWICPHSPLWSLHNCQPSAGSSPTQGK